MPAMRDHIQAYVQRPEKQRLQREAAARGISPADAAGPLIDDASKDSVPPSGTVTVLAISTVRSPKSTTQGVATVSVPMTHGFPVQRLSGSSHRTAAPTRDATVKSPSVTSSARSGRVGIGIFLRRGIKHCYYGVEGGSQ